MISDVPAEIKLNENSFSLAKLPAETYDFRKSKKNQISGKTRNPVDSIPLTINMQITQSQINIKVNKFLDCSRLWERGVYEPEFCKKNAVQC